MNKELQEKTGTQEPDAASVKKKRFGVIRKLKELWKNKKRRKWIVLAVIAVIMAVLALRSCGSKQAAVQTAYTEEPTAYRSITQTLSGSGTLQPANSYVVTTLKQGEILRADFEEGDTVTTDTVLYELDSSDVASNLEKAQLSLDQAQRSYEKAAYAQAPVAGVVASLNVRAGDNVQAGQTVATVRDNSTMTLKVPFASDDAAGFSVGQSAAVTLDNSFETLTGKVTMVSAADTVLTGNRIVRYVTISVSNPGGLTDTQAATATINNCGSSESTTLQYKAAVEVTASAGGTVSAINVKEGGKVSAGQAIVTFSSNAQNDQVQSASDNLRSAELTMKTTQDQMDDYTIKSPINGTIVDKQYKAGDRVESGKSMCTIYDLSYLELIMNIDELDISQVKVGQSVEITAEAVEGKTFTGTITKVSVAGTTTNGTTSYPVTVRIDENESLWPGMNVDAKIVVSANDNALAIPVGAVERGNRVLITAASPSASNAMEDASAPEGYVYVKVETGVSDNDYIEITSGLQEGDTVAYIPATASSISSYDQMMRDEAAMSGPPGGGSGGGPGGSGGPSGGPQG